VLLLSLEVTGGNGYAVAKGLNDAGSIVNITSLGAELAFPNNLSYQISKAGLQQLTKALARDWGEKGFRANNICPKYINTEMTTKSFADNKLNKQRKKHTNEEMGRINRFSRTSYLSYFRRSFLYNRHRYLC
tara:strand:+ start:658 stop:1053 length:396 start_codon:yes stop_codon:yes gene_type:complete